MIKKIRQITKKRNFAIPAAAAAMPVNPNSAATSAITKKITGQRNIFHLLQLNRASTLLRPSVHCDRRVSYKRNPFPKKICSRSTVAPLLIKKLRNSGVW